LFFGGGLNSDDPYSTWGMESMIVTSCAFCGRKFSHVWNYQLMFCLDMYHFGPLWHTFYFHQVFSEGMQSRNSPKLLGKFQDFKTWGEVG
jgi:hypothetical protein